MDTYAVDNEADIVTEDYFVYIKQLPVNLVTIMQHMFPSRFLCVSICSPGVEETEVLTLVLALHASSPPADLLHSDSLNFNIFFVYCR